MSSEFCSEVKVAHSVLVLSMSSSFKSRWGYLIPGDDKSRFRLTHFLCIPLATSKSRSQLNGARQRLMRDPVTSNIPTEAFVWPDTQKLTLGELSLQSDSEVSKAKSLLRSLNLDDMLGRLRSGNERRQGSGTLDKPGDPHKVQPISVSIKGFDRSKHDSARLNAAIIDTESILSSFFLTIQTRFLEAGLMKLTPGRTLNGNRRLRMVVIDTGRIFITTPRKNQPLLKATPKSTTLYMTLRPDVTELCTKYQDFAWASDIQLEKLSICEMGLHNFKRGPLIVGQGNREIACVALPGAAQPDLSAVMDSVTYTHVEKKRNVDPNAVYDVTSR